MFKQANQPTITLTVQDISNDFRVLEFTGREALNTPYRFDLILVSENPRIELKQFMHMPAFLAFKPDGSGIHGSIDCITRGESGKRFTQYQITLRPRLWRLIHSFDQRIFQGLNTQQIIAQVLKKHGVLVDEYAFHLNTEYPARDYCVQYNESDLHFIHRLCEEEGLSYHFQHTERNHVLVFGDDLTVFPKLNPVSFQQESGLLAIEPVIKHMAVRFETRATRTTWRDYDFQNPARKLESEHQTSLSPDLEHYEYPGRFTKRARGTLLAKRALERHRADYQMAEGGGDASGLISGHFLALARHPHQEWNDLWLLTEVTHFAKQPQVLEESLPSDGGLDARRFDQGYFNTFKATPWDVFYRPALNHPKPRIRGSQSAIVTGPANEEIHCDEYGRVKVQFHWDRDGKENDDSSCWLRVSSAWTGSRYGAVAIPRVGMEVLVGFLEGDPDQPLVIGCLYHQKNAVPYPLPAHKTRGLFKTLSSPGGKGFNELRLEDKKGQEQIFIHAQRDWDERVVNDQRVLVSGQRHDKVIANSYSEFKAEQHHTVDLARKVVVHADDHKVIAGSEHLQLGNRLLVDALSEIHLSSGQKIVLEAGAQITLKAGGAWLTVGGQGVALSGSQIRGNQGGSPGVGTPLAALLPGALAQAATSLAGALLSPAQVNTLARNAPFCEECEKCKDGSCEI